MNTATTRLLTLLNVSALKTGKRKRLYDDVGPSEKLNKRKSIHFSPEPVEATIEEETKDEEITEEAEKDEDEEFESKDPYEQHFGTSPALLSQSVRENIDNRSWSTTKKQYAKLGFTVAFLPSSLGPQQSVGGRKRAVLERLRLPFEARQAKQLTDQKQLQIDILDTISTYRDLYVTSTSLDSQQSTRETITLHALNHVTKKRRRVLKNNERLTHASKATPAMPPPEDVQDQGFTRPSVLFLLPFRSSALNWMNALTSHTPSPEYQIENHSRFQTEYGLPEGAVDKLATAEPGVHPRDHVETFKGNVDDSFRLGVKMTRKSVKLFTEFYGCDIIFASPLGLRMSMEKEKNSDFLSSIEILIMDQMDTLTMQNWEHVQFVLSHMNQLPKESHNTDFSRIKPWYLDGYSAYLRQSIFLSAFETVETRALFNNDLKNIAGKIRTEKRWPPIQVPEGIEQNFAHFDPVNPKEEADRRFNYFTSQLLPSILKSAVQSANTVIFIPSSFDFIRMHNFFKKQIGVSFTVLSEYSSNQDISRARQAFFLGKKSFLLISERFHFYKRYKIRGIRNLVFYGPPDHPQFYTELLSYPFLDDGVEASDITCRVLYSKYDWFKLERIAGTEAAVGLLKGN